MVNIDSWFQHTAARRRLLLYASCPSNDWLVSTHSRPKAAAKVRFEITGRLKVSTHSRPKAAAFVRDIIVAVEYSFNTQPPEGGCLYF